MDTKKQNISASKKGGRNPFAKLLLPGGLIVGAGLAEAVERWRTGHHHTPDDNSEETGAEDAANVGEEQTAENAGNTHEPQPESPQTNEQGDTGGLHPVDPADPQTQDNTASTGNGTEAIDETAERIANSDEFDPIDNDFTSFMKVGEHNTLYTENGEVDVFSIELNDPNLEGYPFYLADTDGDGLYDTILLADGTPADIHINAPEGHPDMLDYYIAQQSITQADLEEMHATDGSYLHPDEDMALNDDPTGDMIDENGQPVQQEQIAQNTNSEEDEDPTSFLAYVHQQFFGEDDDETPASVLDYTHQLLGGDDDDADSDDNDDVVDSDSNELAENQEEDGEDDDEDGSIDDYES